MSEGMPHPQPPDVASLTDDQLLGLLRSPHAPPERIAVARSEMERRQARWRASLSPSPGAPASAVVVRDFDMPISSMVVFMLKWAVASIPALLILLLIGSCATTMIGGVLFGGRPSIATPAASQSDIDRAARPTAP